MLWAVTTGQYQRGISAFGIIPRSYGVWEKQDKEKEKRMGQFFSIDSGLMGFLSKVSDICIIGILWIICCLPVVTIGASTTAAYYTMVKVVRRQIGTLHKEFFRSFKNNFKDSAVINLVYLVIGAALVFNIYTMYRNLEISDAYMPFQMFFLYLTLFFLVIAAGLYTYPVLSRFEIGKMKLVKFSVMILFRHFPTTLLLLAMWILAMAGVLYLPVGVVFLPGLYLYLCSFFMERILRRYMNEEMLKIWDGETENQEKEETGEKRGPTAPKDPEKMRPFFYIMRGKEIFGLKQPDGRGIQFIYEDGGRLINSAQIVGNITDTQMLDLLKSAEGFCSLVHSIGVSIETEDPEEKVDFVFQMYGREITQGSTTIRRSLSGNGVEERILLEETAWSANDREPGQIRFEFEKPEILGVANVRLFLRDGFDAPQPEEEEKIDFESEDYRKMISRSLMHLGNTARVRKAAEKAKRGEDVTIAYIGGSITQGAGATPIHHECYAYKSYRAFSRLAAKDGNVHYIKAGVGGTPSELGMIRFERDILRDHTAEPDIVVIEFAVNDEGDETKGNCYESLVRKVLNLPWQPAVVLLFAVFASDWNLQERLKPVGYHYDLPMVSIMDAVTPQFKLKADQGRVLSKNQFFYDVFHPSNAGHTVMADCLTYFFEQAIKGEKDAWPAGADVEDQRERQEDMTEKLLQQNPVIGCDFEKVMLLDRKENLEGKEICCGSFRWKDETLQCVEMDEDLTGTAEFPHNWMYQGSREKKQPYFELKIRCKALLLVFKDSGDALFGKADVFVDGKKKLTADPLINGWVHANPVILIQEKESGIHTVRIGMAEGEEEKNFTILGFGYVK